MNFSAIRSACFAITGVIFLALSLTAHAASVTVDGNLTDLISAVSANPTKSGTVTESGTDAESNGFDIVNGYMHYDWATDTFYVGMNFNGQVGTAGGQEGGFTPACNYGYPGNYSGNAGVFDKCETYGFNIDIGNNSTVDFELRKFGDAVANSGLDTEVDSVLTNAGGATSWHWIVSELNNGVEFSVTGLNLVSTLPTDVRIGFFAGSINNAGPEDSAYLNVTVIPVPAAAWLFGSGLIALVGFARKRRSH